MATGEGHLALERVDASDSESRGLVGRFVGVSLQVADVFATHKFLAARGSESGVIQVVILYPDVHGSAAAWPSDGHGAYERARASGIPQFEREATNVQYLGRYGPCDRYDGSEFSTALDYEESTEKILMVQLLLPDAVPKSR